MDFIETVIGNSLFQNILSGIVGGLIVLGIQIKNDKKQKEKEKIEHSIVGEKKLKILSKDFLYHYEPGKITVEKLIEDFGQPHRKYKFAEYENLFFEFQNAKLEVINSLEFNSIIALTVFSKLDYKYPINCRLSFEENDEILGKAKISDVIISNHFSFKSQKTPLGFETIIGTHNNYRQTKHLNYYYLVGGNFNDIEKTKNEIINQVCVTESKDVYAFLSFNDTFYN